MAPADAEKIAYTDSDKVLANEEKPEKIICAL